MNNLKQSNLRQDPNDDKLRSVVYKMSFWLTLVLLSSACLKPSMIFDVTKRDALLNVFCRFIMWAVKCELRGYDKY